MLVVVPPSSRPMNHIHVQVNVNAKHGLHIARRFVTVRGRCYFQVIRQHVNFAIICVCALLDGTLVGVFMRSYDVRDDPTNFQRPQADADEVILNYL